MENNIKNKAEEPDSAMAAGERALRSLGLAQEHLKSTGKYGLWDVFGGGFLSGAMKRSKVDEAKNCMARARDHLAVFKGALEDMQAPADFLVDLGEFIKFADYFIDSNIADWAVQSRISDAKIQVSIITEKVGRMVRWLRDDI